MPKLYIHQHGNLHVNGSPQAQIQFFIHHHGNLPAIGSPQAQADLFSCYPYTPTGPKDLSGLTPPPLRPQKEKRPHQKAWPDKREERHVQRRLKSYALLLYFTHFYCRFQDIFSEHPFSLFGIQ